MRPRPTVPRCWVGWDALKGTLCNLGCKKQSIERAGGPTNLRGARKLLGVTPHVLVAPPLSSSTAFASFCSTHERLTFQHHPACSKPCGGTRRHRHPACPRPRRRCACRARGASGAPAELPGASGARQVPSGICHAAACLMACHARAARSSSPLRRPCRHSCHQAPTRPRGDPRQHPQAHPGVRRREQGACLLAHLTFYVPIPRTPCVRQATAYPTPLLRPPPNPNTHATHQGPHHPHERPRRRGRRHVHCHEPGAVGGRRGRVPALLAARLAAGAAQRAGTACHGARPMEAQTCTPPAAAAAAAAVAGGFFSRRKQQRRAGWAEPVPCSRTVCCRRRPLSSPAAPAAPPLSRAISFQKTPTPLPLLRPCLPGPGEGAAPHILEAANVRRAGASHCTGHRSSNRPMRASHPIPPPLALRAPQARAGPACVRPRARVAGPSLNPESHKRPDCPRVAALPPASSRRTTSQRHRDLPGADCGLCRGLQLYSHERQAVARRARRRQGVARDDAARAARRDRPVCDWCVGLGAIMVHGFGAGPSSARLSARSLAMSNPPALVSQPISCPTPPRVAPGDRQRAAAAALQGQGAPGNAVHRRAVWACAVRPQRGKAARE
jgi:hypothetical protein